MKEPQYLTVGELARLVGVTVRTIQYYDQEGLLSPSAKGPQNQRLYTEENVRDLYRILTLKYLGLPLARIKEDNTTLINDREMHSLILDQMEDVENQLQELFKRFTALRQLLELNDDNNENNDNWEAMVGVIEDSQNDSQFFWRLTGIRDEEVNGDLPVSHLSREEMISKWHELIADALRLVSENEPLSSVNNSNLAHRYLALGELQQTLSVDQNFILMENFAPHYHAGGAFDALRDTVSEHLEAVVAEYKARNNHSASSQAHDLPGEQTFGDNA